MLLLMSTSALKAYNVTFYVNGQVYSTTNVEKSGQEITLTPPNTQGIDCPFSIYFNAWSTNDDPANPDLIKGDPSGASISYPKVKVTSDMNFYAMWNLGYSLIYSFDYYTVTVNNSENGTVETTQYFGGDYLSDYVWASAQSDNAILYKVLKGNPIAFEAKANEGYEFDSWAVGFNRGVQQSDNKVKIVVNSNGVLSASFHEKAPEVDFTPLNTVINEARNYMSEDLKEDKYESVRLTLYNAVEEAESLKTNNKTQAEIDAGVWALRDVLKQAKNDKEAIDNAEQNDSSKVNYDALNNKQTEAINYMNSMLLEDKYDEVRWALQDAIEEAESLKMFDRTQAEIDAGVKALSDALTKAMNDKATIDNAEQNDSSKVSYAALDSKVAEVRTYINDELQADKYDEVRWPLYNAIEEAESLKMFDRTQAEIDAGVKALADALTKAMADKKAIDEKAQDPVISYENLTALYNEGVYYYYAIAEKSKYSEPANKLLNELLDVMSMIDNKTATSQQQVDNAYNHLSETFSEVKEAVAAIDKAEDEGKPQSQKAFEKVYAEAQAYYNDIYYDYGSIASSFQSEYSRAANRVTWGGSVTDEEYDQAAATIEKALQKAKEAVAAAKVGYNEKELTDAISDAVAYYKGIESDYSDIAATLAVAIEKANTAKANLTSQADVDNAVVDIQNAVADAMAAVKKATPSAEQKQSLAFVTTNDGYSYHRKQYGYDAQGRISQALGMSLNTKDNTWVLDTCYTYEYPDQYTVIEYAKTTHGEPEFVEGSPVYNWEWMYKEVTVTTGSAKEMKLYYYDSSKEAWYDEASRTQTTVYDELGREVKVISEYNMTEIEYEGNKKTVTTYESYGGEGSYTPYRRETTARDDNGNLLLKQSYYYQNGAWVISNEYEYKYSDDNVYLGYVNTYYTNGNVQYTSDNTYRVERDAQNRIVKKIKSNGGSVYSTIEYNGYVATESVGSDKIITRVLDSEGNLMRYTLKENRKNWNTNRWEWSTKVDMKYEYDKSVLAADVVGGMTFLREPNGDDYGEDDPACVSYKLKYALAKATNNGIYDKTQNIYSLQPVTVKPASYDLSASEPIITIPVATIVDKVECDEGAVVEIVDEAGNVVFEKKITSEDLDAENGMFSQGSMKIQGFSKTYRKPTAHEFDAKKEETMGSKSKGLRSAFVAQASSADAAVIGEGRYFVQISGGAVKVNGKAINQVVSAMTVGNVLLGDVNGDGAVTREDADMIMNYYLGNAVENFNASAADVNGDGEISVADANAVVNIYIKK